MIPDSLYQQFRSYKQGVLPRFYRDYVSATATASSLVGAMAKIPDEYDALIQNVNWYGGSYPGGGEILQRLRIKIVYPTGEIWKGILKVSEYKGLERDNVNWSGSLLIPSRSYLYFDATFSAALVAKDGVLTVQGYLIPKLSP